MKLAIAQIHPFWNDPDSSFSSFYKIAQEAKDKGASILLFPEQAATGWDPTDNKTWIETIDGSIVSRFRELARDVGIVVLGSFRERTATNPKNTAVLIDKNGEILLSYSKNNLFYPAQEDRFYSPGEKQLKEVVTCEGFVIGVAICFDLRFCEVFSRYQKRGAELILIPTAWPVSTIQYMSLFARSRAVEVNCFIACANFIGQTPVNTYNGKSIVVAPNGEIICDAGSNEGLIIAELSRAALQRKW